jgi:hypothetical protein
VPNSQRLLELALKGLEAERENIDDEIAQIKGQLNPRQAVAERAGAGPNVAPKKTMSATARKKISEGMKRRYAEIKKAGERSHVSQVRTSAVVSPKQSTVKKQNGGDRLTAAGRKKLSDLMKKRWAEKRQGQKVKQKKK